MDFKSLNGFRKILEFEEIWTKPHLYGWDLERETEIRVRFTLKFQSTLDYLILLIYVILLFLNK